MKTQQCPTRANTKATVLCAVIGLQASAFGATLATNETASPSSLTELRGFNPFLELHVTADIQVTSASILFDPNGQADQFSLALIGLTDGQVIAEFEAPTVSSGVAYQPFAVRGGQSDIIPAGSTVALYLSQGSGSGTFQLVDNQVSEGVVDVFGTRVQFTRAVAGQSLDGFQGNLGFRLEGNNLFEDTLEAPESTGVSDTVSVPEPSVTLLGGISLLSLLLRRRRQA